MPSADRASQVLPWRDVLHDGPVPAPRRSTTRDPLDADGLAAVRARFLAAAFEAGEEEGIRRSLLERNRRLAEGLAAGAICLWLEHDVYDQLQLLEIAGQLAGTSSDREDVWLIALAEHPEVPDFRGLGQLSPQQLAALWPRRQRLSPAAIAWAADGWAAFRAPDPSRLVAWLSAGPPPEASPVAPLTVAALERWLAEFPAVDSGLAESERCLLEGLEPGAQTGAELFRRHLAGGDRLLFGDASFALRLDDLTAAPLPLVVRAGDGAAGDRWQRTYRLSDEGRRALAGEVDRVAAGGIDRWLGGVHLQGRSVPWRWRPSERRLIATDS